MCLLVSSEKSLSPYIRSWVKTSFERCRRNESAPNKEGHVLVISFGFAMVYSLKDVLIVEKFLEIGLNVKFLGSLLATGYDAIVRVLGPSKPCANMNQETPRQNQSRQIFLMK